MAYIKKDWKPRKGSGLNKFTMSGEVGNVVYLDNIPDSITDPGTPFTAENMNHIEEGIESAHVGIAAETQARQQGDATLTTAISNLTKDNIGLGNVTNDVQVKRSEMGNANGVATLNSNGKVPLDQLPEFMSGEGDSEALARAKEYTDEAVADLSAETSGKIDKVPNADGKLPQFDVNGNLVNTGKTISDLLSEGSSGSLDGQVPDKAIALPVGANLNNYRVPGFYNYINDGDSNTVVNKPSDAPNNAFALIVLRG
jgi:hypothetical protein